jgi:hypothetical protein
MKADRHGCCASPALAACRGLLALALVAVSLSGHAAGFPAFMQTVTGKSTTVKAASNGTPIVTTSVGLTPGGGWQSAGNFGVAQGTAGAINVAGKGNVNVNGKQVPVQVNGSVSKSDIAGAVISCATGGMLGCAAAAIPLAMAWMGNAGTRINPENGALELNTSAGCSVYPCTRYTYQKDGWVSNGYTMESACAGTIGRTILTGGSTLVITGAALFGTVCGVGYTRTNGTVVAPGAGEGLGMSSQGGLQPPSPTWYPTTSAAAREALIKSNPVPGIVSELANAGATPESLPVGSIGVTGPASIAGATTTTTNNIDNSVKTSTTTNNYTYNGGTVTNAGTVTTSTTTGPSGTTTESTTSTMNPGDEAAAPPEENKVQCDKYPNSLGCAELDTPAGTIPKATKEVSYTAESVWGGGSCPQDKQWASQTMGRSYTLIPWSTACGWAVSMRAVVLLLAAWAAFWIVMPGNTQVKPQ